MRIAVILIWFVVFVSLLVYCQFIDDQGGVMPVGAMLTMLWISVGILLAVIMILVAVFRRR